MKKAPVLNMPNVSRAAVKAAIAAGTFRKLKTRVAASGRLTKSKTPAKKSKPVWKRPIDARSGRRDMDEINYDSPRKKRAIAMKMETPENAERKRCRQMTALEDQAALLGVKFSATRAIERGMSVTKARAEIMDAATAKDAVEGGRTSRTAPKRLTHESKVSVWKKAVAQSESSMPSQRANTTVAAPRQMTRSAKVSAWKKAVKRDA